MTGYSNGAGARPGESDMADADIALITGYLAKELTPEQEAGVADRLEHDDAFFEKVWPVVEIWRMPVRFREMHARFVESGAVLNSLEASVGEPSLVVSDGAPRRTARTLATTPRRRAWFRFDLAAARLGLDRAVRLVAGIAFMMVGGGGYVGYTGTRQLHMASMGLRLGYAAGSGGQVVYSTKRGETRALTPEAGARIELRPYSQLTWRPNSMLLNSRTLATLKGEALFDVRGSAPPLFVATAAGGMVLWDGLFAVRCERGCADVRVSVVQGAAWLHGATGTDWTLVRAGEHGHVWLDGGSERTRGYEYPGVAKR